MTQATSLKERFIAWCGALTLTSFIPFLITFPTELSPEQHATTVAMVFGIANGIILIVAPVTSMHLKSANHCLWLLAGIGSFFALPIMAITLSESSAGTAGFHYLLVGLIALSVLTMFFTLLWWGTEARKIPASLALPISAAHTGLLLWCGLASSYLPFVLYIFLAATALFNWRRQLLPTKAPS